MEIRIGVQHRRQNPILERPRTGFVTLLIAVKRNKQNFPQLRCDVLRRMLADAIGRMPLGRRPLERRPLERRPLERRPLGRRPLGRRPLETAIGDGHWRRPLGRLPLGPDREILFPNHCFQMVDLQVVYQLSLDFARPVRRGQSLLEVRLFGKLPLKSLGIWLE